ncbi:hypothetical protein [Rhodohalobacter barkolensis]|uniref:Uncharacterized protein n=1 Tax=Rhodohalobacter barkolensis TaxID=2053187 RepID=A0A2N0VK37_9BACT|nr:hypothetical protein [Rhodohalobacter barkolensis]PKD44541.1 hypothetical protein CWD77_03490 [Rhodohalobacter barkolensis]
MWSELLIILTSALGAAYIFTAFDGKHRDVKNVGLFTLLCIVIFQLNQFLDYSSNISSIVTEVLYLSIFSLVLTFLLLTIRKLKPEFARYPYPIAFIPVLIVVLYPLIIGNESILNLVGQLLQLAGLLTLLLLIISHLEHSRIIATTSISFILFLSGAAIYWFDGSIPIGSWLWQSLVAVAIALISYSMTKFYNNNEAVNRYEIK